LRVAVDICNTIANVNLELLRYFNITLDDYPSPVVPEGFFDTYKGREVYIRAEPFPGSQNVLRTFLKEGYVIEYVTTRPPSAEFITKRWLSVHGFPLGQVIFVDSPKEKVIFAEKRNYAAFFEDDPRVIKPLFERGYEVYVKDWIYNRFLQHDLISRFRKWSDVA